MLASERGRGRASEIERDRDRRGERERGTHALSERRANRAAGESDRENAQRKRGAPLLADGPSLRHHGLHRLQDHQ